MQHAWSTIRTLYVSQCAVNQSDNAFFSVFWGCRIRANWAEHSEKVSFICSAMQPWLISVVVVAIVTMISLFLGSFDSLELDTQKPVRITTVQALSLVTVSKLWQVMYLYVLISAIRSRCWLIFLAICMLRYQEFGLNCNYLSESVEKVWSWLQNIAHVAVDNVSYPGHSGRARA